MKANEDPFFWQERGASTRWLPWAVGVAYGLLLSFYVVGAIATWDLGFIGAEGLAGLFVGGGLLTVVLASAIHGAGILAREKSRRTAPALLLTGNHPAHIFRAKVLATYWALRWSLLAVAVVTLVVSAILAGSSGELGGAAVLSVAIICVLLLGPGIAVLVGMVFGSVSATPLQAVRALLLSVLWYFALSFLFSSFFRFGLLIAGPGFIPVIIFIWVYVRVNRRWTPWRLSVLLALTLHCGTNVAAVLLTVGVAGLSPRSSGVMGIAPLLALVGGAALLAAFALFWWRLGVRIFDAGMASEPGLVREARGT